MMRAAILAALLCAPAAADVRVIDGDTIRYRGETVRLAGIDAPERRQYGNGYNPPRCERWLGELARDALESALAGRSVRVETWGDCAYGRRCGVVYADGLNVNRAMVAWGRARWWRKGQARGGWC